MTARVGTRQIQTNSIRERGLIRNKGHARLLAVSGLGLASGTRKQRQLAKSPSADGR